MPFNILHDSVEYLSVVQHLRDPCTNKLFQINIHIVINLSLTLGSVSADGEET